jgi:vitamin K-dependent gamma-carboxylase-like protein
MKLSLRAWNRFWFAPVETSTFALLRIAFALVTLAWTLSLAPSLFAFYSKDGILPAQPDYEGNAAWGLLGVFTGNAAVMVLYFLLFVSSISLLFGFQTRIAALVVFVCLVSFGRRNPWVLNSGDLLLQALAFYVLLMPSGAALSVDRWLKRGERFWEFPARAIWPLRLVQIQVSIIYIAAVWAKVRGTTWNDGTAVSYAMRIDDIGRLPVPGFITDSLLISNILTYGTLATELAIGILVWNRVLRPWVLLLGVGLHLGIDYSVRVGFFSYAILITYIAFLPPGTATSLILSFRDRLAGWSPRPSLRRATRKL